MTTRRKAEYEKVYTREERRIQDWRDWKLARMAEQSKGTLQQQRLVALELSKPWAFTPAEEVEFMLTPIRTEILEIIIDEEELAPHHGYRTLTDYYLLTGYDQIRPNLAEEN